MTGIQRHIGALVIFVDRAGRAGFTRPAPRSQMGVGQSLIGGFTVPCFVSPVAERLLRHWLWDRNPAKWQQIQIEA